MREQPKSLERDDKKWVPVFVEKSRENKESSTGCDAILSHPVLVRREPTWRIPIGVLALVSALLIYGGIVARLLSPVLSRWPVLAQLPIYLVLGVVWLLPLRRFMIWMETGRLK